MRALWCAAVAVLLAACGGGGGGGGDASPPGPSSPGVPVAQAAGAYWVQSASVNGSAYLHSDGTISVELTQAHEHVDVFGTLSPTAAPAVSGQVDYDKRSSGSRVHGATTLSLSTSQVEGVPAISLQLGADVPFPVRTVSLKKLAVPAAPAPETLTGLYGMSVKLGWPEMYVMHTRVRIVMPAGTVSGDLGAGCTVTGRLSGYDPASTMYRQELTFAGADCPMSGTAQMVGRVVPGATPTLLSEGFIHGVRLQVTTSWPEPIPTAAFGMEAGHYLYRAFPDFGGQRAELNVHPDGQVTASVLNYNQQTGITNRLMFVGVAERSSSGFVATGQVVSAQQGPGTVSHQSGTATLQVTPGVAFGARSALDVRISTSVPNQLPTFTAPGPSRFSKLHGLPFSFLGGSYSTATAFTPTEENQFGDPPEIVVDVRLDPATGAVTGAFGPGCSLSGRVYDYDPWAQMFKQEVVLQGAGCAVTGSGTLLGHLYLYRDAQLQLVSEGVVGGRALRLMLQQAAPLVR